MLFHIKDRRPKIIAVSAHPDDETLGAGGTLIRHVENGDEVSICVVTKPYTPDWSEEEVKRARIESERAFAEIGAAECRYLDYPTVALNTIPFKDISNAVMSYIREIEPDLIYAPFYGDLNSDHGIVSRAVAVATRPIAGNNRRTTMYYETISSTEWGSMYFDVAFHPNLYVDIDGTLEKKLKVLSCFHQEIREFPHPRSLEGIKILARKRGMEVGLMAAEAFKLSLHIEF